MRNSRRRFAIAVAVLFSGWLGTGLSAAIIALGQCPGPVQKTIEKQAKGGTFGAIDRLEEGGRVVFATVISLPGKQFAIQVGEHGRLLHKTLVEPKKIAVKVEKKKEGKGKGGADGKSGSKDTKDEGGAAAGGSSGTAPPQSARKP